MPPFKISYKSKNRKSSKFLRSSDDANFLEKSEIQENVSIGVKYKTRSKPPIIGKKALIRSNSIIYDDVEIGDNFKTGHGVLIREKLELVTTFSSALTPLLKDNVPSEIISASNQMFISQLIL